MEDRLLVMLEYFREYRTHFHIAQSRGLSETRVREIIHWCEETLIKSGRFTLPEKKVLSGSDMMFEVVLKGMHNPRNSKEFSKEFFAACVQFKQAGKLLSTWEQNDYNGTTQATLNYSQRLAMAA